MEEIVVVSLCLFFLAFVFAFIIKPKKRSKNGVKKYSPKLKHI